MKKLISLVLVIILSISIFSIPTVGNAKKVDKTSYVFRHMNTYKGKTYFCFPESEMYENSKAVCLPDKVLNRADTFVMKDNKIYFKTYSKNSYKVKICSSNLKGGNIKTLVSNCYKYSKPYILNNKLYYEKYTNGKNRPAAISLKTKKKVKLSKKYSVAPQVVDKGVGYFVKDNNIYAYNHFTNKLKKITKYNGNYGVVTGIVGISGNTLVYYYCRYSKSFKFGLAKINIKTKKSKFIKNTSMEEAFLVKGKNIFSTRSGLYKLNLNGKTVMNKKVDESGWINSFIEDGGNYLLSSFSYYDSYYGQFVYEIYMISPGGKFCQNIATQYQ